MLDAGCWNARKTWNLAVHDKPSRPLQRVAAAESPLHVHLHTTPPAIAIDIARPPAEPSHPSTSASVSMCGCHYLLHPWPSGVWCLMRAHVCHTQVPVQYKYLRRAAQL